MATLHDVLTTTYAAQNLDDLSADAARVHIGFANEQLIDLDLGVVEAVGLDLTMPFLSLQTTDETVIRVLSIPTASGNQFRATRYLPANERPHGGRVKPGQPGWQDQWNSVPLTNRAAQDLIQMLEPRTPVEMPAPAEATSQSRLSAGFWRALGTIGLHRRA